MKMSDENIDNLDVETFERDVNHLYTEAIKKGNIWTAFKVKEAWAKSKGLLKNPFKGKRELSSVEEIITAVEALEEDDFERLIELLDQKLT
jgi:hypothetical protein